MADGAPELTALTADIVSAYVSNNEIKASELAGLIASVHGALGSAGEPAKVEAPDHTVDKAAIRKSMSEDYLTSFVDGKKYKSLKRHLGVAGMTPDEYRGKFGLPKDYPMVAPAYADARSNLAKTMGLGRKAGTPALEMPEPEAEAVEPAPVEEEAAKKPRRGRAKAAV